MSNFDILLLVFILLGAFMVPFITRKIQMPNAAGEIIYGLLIGFFVIKNRETSHLIEFLGELGFILLMYLAGMEIDFNRLRNTRKKEIGVYISMYFLMFAISIIAVKILNLPSIFIIVLVTTAVGLLFPVLKDADILHTETGQKFLLIGTIGEVFSLIAFTGFILYSKYGFSKESLFHILEILAFGIFIYFAKKIYHYVIWWNPKLSKVIMKSENTFESSVRGNLANMIIFVGIAALLNLELIIGAFLGGMVFAAIFSQKEDILEKMGSFGYGFLVPIFFISVGMKFNITDFFNMEVFCWSFVFAGIILFIRLVAAPLLLIVGMSVREMIATAISLTFPLTLLVAIATFGLESKIIEKTQTAAILLAAIVTSILYPIIFKQLLKKGSSAKSH